MNGTVKSFMKGDESGGGAQIGAWGAWKKRASNEVGDDGNGGEVDTVANQFQRRQLGKKTHGMLDQYRMNGKETTDEDRHRE